MRNMTEQNITALATERYGTCPDPRLREMIGSLVNHLHAFVREIEPTEVEWMAGIDYLTRVGKMCDDKRQEFIILSDVLGVSILVDAINHRVPDAATPSTVVGPFHIPDSPDFDNGANMAVGAPGTPLVLAGTVSSLDGTPIQNAVVDAWQPDGEGIYEAQKPGQDGPYLRGVYRTDKDGRYVIRTVAPLGYSIPMDGPVADLVTRTDVNRYRPSPRRHPGRSSTCISMCRPTVSNRSSPISFAAATRTWTTTSSSRSRIDWSSISWSTSQASPQTASG